MQASVAGLAALPHAAGRHRTDPHDYRELRVCDSRLALLRRRIGLRTGAAVRTLDTHIWWVSLQTFSLMAMPGCFFNVNALVHGAV